MEAEKSVIEKLIEFAEISKRKITYSEIPFPGNALYGVTHHERNVYIPNNDNASSFLVAYYNPKSMNDNDLYFGVFSPLIGYNDENLIIREKNIIDKANIFGNKNTIKTGTASFDKSTIITGNTQNFDKRLNNIKLQTIIQETLQLNEGLIIGLNNFKLNYVPAFNNKSVFGIYTRLKWIIEPDFIEELFSKTEKMRVLITESEY